MKITLLELKNYKRLQLNNINFLRYTPLNKIQLILGSNGSGKSSLLRELSPLPASPNDYLKDGYKLIHIEHHGSKYVLRSSFGVKREFSFIKNDEELNTGLTMTVYKDLCRKEFNMTQDTHDLLIGKILFTRMTVADRRNWFTYICEADYTYAIKYYNKLKEQLRDIQGAIKLNQSRLVQETDKLLSEQDEVIYRQDILDLNNLVNSLLDIKTFIPDTKEQVIKSISLKEQNILTISQQVKSCIKSISKNITYDSDIDKDIIYHQSSIQSLNNESISINEQLENLNSSLDAINKANIDSISDIDKVIDDLTINIFQLKRTIKYDFNFSNNTIALQALNTIHPNLIYILTSISPDQTNKFTRDYYNGILEKRQQLSNEISCIDKEQFNLINKSKELDHLKEHNQTECPKCRYLWSRGYDKDYHTSINDKITSNSSLLNSLNTSVSELDKEIEDIKSYLDLVKNYRELVSYWDILKPLWDHITTEGLIKTSPRSIIDIVECLKQDLIIAIKIDSLNEQLNNNIKLKSIMSSNQETDKTKISQTIDDLNKQLYTNNIAIQKHKDKVNQLQFTKDTLFTISNKVSQLESLLDNRSLDGDKLIEILRQNMLNEIIQAVKLRLSQKEQVISKIDIQKALVSNLKSQIDELTNQLELLKIAVKELSPTEGLIAKGLTGFINNFVYQVNSFIKKVWLYPLELIPIKLEDDDSLDLDYRFSVKINEDIIINDISEGSNAMREIIDLAFRIVSMQYLKLSEAPVYTDELGSSMDKEHRSNIVTLMQNLSIVDNFSQMFIISHYEEMYGSFRNADINVLCAANIPNIKNSVFNQNLEIG